MDESWIFSTVRTFILARSLDRIRFTVSVDAAGISEAISGMEEAVQEVDDPAKSIQAISM